MNTNPVVILCRDEPSASDNNAVAITEYTGANAEVLSLATAPDVRSVRQLVPAPAALVVSLDTVAALASSADTCVDRLLAIAGPAPVFIYGFEPTGHHAAIISVLSSGSLVGFGNLSENDRTFHVSDNHREYCGQFTGVSVRGVDHERDGCFVEGSPAAGQAVLIRAAGQPFFVRIQTRGTEIFFVTCRELANLDVQVSGEISLLPWFSRLVPFLIFLRAALGEKIWHNDLSQACFIIDDPLLKPRYGFLDYSNLLSSVRQQKFAASIAFIPWNFQRTRREVAELFSTASNSLSLCVHGCDHTKAEFATTQFELLRHKSLLAFDRMQAHSRLSGIPFDDVMVFPQGLFSSEAFDALGACGYLAAVNTEVEPVNNSRALMLRDVLGVAITAFGNTSLFRRHYAKDPAEFAFDLFLGRPALIVEHHGYFRDGYDTLKSFVTQLNSLDEKIEWSNLAAICARAHLRRVTQDGCIEIRFYTNRFLVMNSAAESRTFILHRRWKSVTKRTVVTVNGVPWPFDQRDDRLEIVVPLGPGQKVEIAVRPDVDRTAAGRSHQFGGVRSARVLVRRILSEVRDNHVETSPLLANLLSNARRLYQRARTSGSSNSGPNHAFQLDRVRISNGMSRCDD